MADKLDLYKLHKDEYQATRNPRLVEVKPAWYLTISGQGAPGGEAFSAALSALYNVAFTIKMAQKAAGRDYKICKLEGLWWGSQPDFLAEPPEQWRWKLLIRTPDFVSQDDLESAVAGLLDKGKPAEVGQVRLEQVDEGLCVQALHLGPYDQEQETMARMTAFATEQGLVAHGLHHEIYLSDPRRTPPERLRTILRMPVSAT